MGPTLHSLQDIIRVMRAEKPCAHCKTPTRNAKFCTRSCAASTNNTWAVKRKPKNKRRCRDCGDEYLERTWNRSRCVKCYDTWRDYAARTTLGMLAEKVRAEGHPTSWRWSEVRSHCRALNSHRPRACQVCNYSNHVEYCHIKGLATYPDCATIAEVNDPNNIAILCPNHHWELDHGILRWPPGQDSNLRPPL